VWRAVNFWVLTDNEITADFTFNIQWRPGLNAVSMGSVQVTTDTLTQIPIGSIFSGQNEAIPMPTRVICTRTAGTVDYEIWGMFV